MKEKSSSSLPVEAPDNRTVSNQKIANVRSGSQNDSSNRYHTANTSPSAVQISRPILTVGKPLVQSTPTMKSFASTEKQKQPSSTVKAKTEALKPSRSPNSSYSQQVQKRSHSSTDFAANKKYLSTSPSAAGQARSLPPVTILTNTERKVGPNQRAPTPNVLLHLGGSGNETCIGRPPVPIVS